MRTICLPGLGNDQIPDRFICTNPLCPMGKEDVIKRSEGFTKCQESIGNTEIPGRMTLEGMRKGDIIY